MLKKELNERLNEQMMLEFESANIYKAMSAWCKAKGFEGSARFLNQHAAEEMEHMERLFQYINETGAQAIITGMKAPENEFSSLQEVFEKTYKHEQFITQKIFDLVDFTLQLKDYSTFSFLQWYTAEQHEEEALFKGILDKFEIIGTEGRGLFMIDKEIGNIANSRD
ncbi:non-heme ferritin [Nitratiruptor sp. YY09-18]|uniref:non-heme ferritin n=1 Tax=Nitratiruptor sp. YY09-18 TaxID=2724901 RepID=UPI001915B27E|nr:non-heme ferritin [Nitratiruptor sp. YY09-18]BCD68710.1 ferritin [Nitratiruptor sp. YY09-18]